MQREPVVRVPRRLPSVVGVVLVLAVVVGCSVVGTLVVLGDAGFSVSAVNANSSGGSTTLTVVADSPPGLARDVAVERAERLVWQTQRSRIDRIDLVLDGVETSTTREQLTARYGPRDPALDDSNVDQALLIGIFSGVGLVVVAAVTVAVVVTRRRRRRLRSGPAPDPLWGATDLVGRRVGQFAIDYLVWWVPTVAGVLLAVFGTAALEPGGDGFPVVFFTAAAGSWVLSLAWGWFTYAYWPARHDGQTFGMRRTGLRVVTLDGTPVGLGRHSLRWLLLGVETNFGGLIGLLVMATSHRHQRLGDMAAGTIVVRAAPGPGR